MAAELIKPLGYELLDEKTRDEIEQFSDITLDPETRTRHLAQLYHAVDDLNEQYDRSEPLTPARRERTNEVIQHALALAFRGSEAKE